MKTGYLMTRPIHRIRILLSCSSLNEEVESGRRFEDAEELAMVLFCVNRISHHFRDCELHFTTHTLHLSFPRPLKPCFGANSSIAVTASTNRNKTPPSNKCYSSGGGGEGDIPLLFDSSFRYLSIYQFILNFLFLWVHLIAKKYNSTDWKQIIQCFCSHQEDERDGISALTGLFVFSLEVVGIVRCYNTTYITDDYICYCQVEL